MFVAFDELVWVYADIGQGAFLFNNLQQNMQRMMRAIVLEAAGEAPKFKEIPVPIPRSG